MTTRVINVRIPDEAWDVYVGRGADPRTGKRSNRWGNQFVIGQGMDRDAVIAAHLQHVLERPWLIDAIRSDLKGLTLGCWCKPRPCHGDTLATIADSAPVGHVLPKCSCEGRPHGPSCNTCAGISTCLHCNGGEGALTSECPKSRYDLDDVYAGRLNYIFGTWVNASRAGGDELSMPCNAGKIHWEEKAK